MDPSGPLRTWPQPCGAGADRDRDPFVTGLRPARAGRRRYETPSVRDTGGRGAGRVHSAAGRCGQAEARAGHSTGGPQRGRTEARVDHSTGGPRRGRVEAPTERGRGPGPPRAGRHLAVTGSGSVLLVVQPGEPGRQPVDGRLELGVQVHEVTQPFGQPLHRDLVLAAPLGQLLDAPIREVHRHLPRAQRPSSPRDTFVLSPRHLERRIPVTRTGVAGRPPPGAPPAPPRGPWATPLPVPPPPVG